MSKKLNRSIDLEIIGEETEVDKNIIERISDPLIHLIRNSIDHGIEDTQERIENGKSATGKLTLEAKNAGGDVWIIVRDDGRGLSKEKILDKARENGLIHKPESELTDKEIYSFIFLPGFSTKDSVTEFVYNKSDFNNGKARYYAYKSPQGLNIRYFLLKSSDGIIRAAFDSCDTCWSAGKGYRQVKREIGRDKI